MNAYDFSIEEDSYAKGCEFAAHIFTTFNGRINPSFPARYLLFGTISSNPYDFAVTAGDIVQIDIHKILRRIHEIFDGKVERMGKIECFRGLIIYSIVHELLHLQQDLEYYYRIIPNNEEAEEVIEMSCHCMTEATLKSLTASNLIYFSLDDSFSCFIPSLGMFLGWQREEDAGRFEELVRSYYPLQCYQRKDLWYANAYLFGCTPRKPDRSDDTIFNLAQENHSIFIDIGIGKWYQNCNYLSYMNRWMTPRTVMGLVNPLILLSMQGFSRKTSISEYRSDDFPGMAIFKVEVDDPSGQALQIVSQLPTDEQPVPPIL